MKESEEKPKGLRCKSQNEKTRKGSQSLFEEILPKQSKSEEQNDI